MPAAQTYDSSSRPSRTAALVRALLPILVLTLLYVLLANARTVARNALVPGQGIAVSMIVPVLAGVLFGRWNGLLVGVAGTALNILTPAGNPMDALSIAPHGIMGFAAGFLANRLPTPLPMFTLYLGHMLNIALYVAMGEVRTTAVLRWSFAAQFLAEGIVGVMACMILTSLYRVTIIPEDPPPHKAESDIGEAR